MGLIQRGGVIDPLAALLAGKGRPCGGTTRVLSASAGGVAGANELEKGGYNSHHDATLLGGWEQVSGHNSSPTFAGHPKMSARLGAGGMRILIVDANPMLWHGVTSLLRQQTDFEVVGKVQNGVEAVQKAQELRPDIILIAIHLPQVDGLEVARKVKQILPHVEIVLFTSSEKDEELLESIMAGARGYLLKQIMPEGLSQALRGVVRGEVAISRAACTKLFEAFADLNRNGPENRCLHEAPSPREWEVLQSLVIRASNKEIAATLGISEHTVKSHLKKISAKLHLKNRVQAVTYALRFGYLRPGRE